MITTSELLAQLGFLNSPVFLRGANLDSAPAFSHTFRLAREKCGLVGVYTLRRYWDESDRSTIPVVYICEAESTDDADKIHRLVWNQNTVPFLIVRTPTEFRLYSGFAFHSDKGRSATSVLRESVDALEVSQRFVPSFHAERIDDGTVWRREGQFVTPRSRVDWRLLENLKSLGEVLREDMGLSRSASHALIGKYVYLRYLRDRRILSPERFTEFGIDEQAVFGRRATLKSFKKLISRLDRWLNGSVFDIPWDDGIQAAHVKQVAGAFFGDDPQTGQLNLIEDYDFSHIPIETLSVVYEQFLHAEGKARDVGAYYTPIPLVDFVLDGMEELRPLKTGVRVLDPSCGSGAFLVQAYRRLIERERARKSSRLKPTQLRKLLVDHFFGIDRDEDACQVAELSLLLTLLDYVEPPDLLGTKFKLPLLRGSNLFSGADEDFFNTGSQFHQTQNKPFHWIIGNPPWTEISAAKPKPEDRFTRDWSVKNRSRFLTSGNQVAELFTWKVTEHAADDGAIGLLVPAMTLFKSEARSFRRQFFDQCRVESVVNFSNMAEMLFAGRSRVPCAAFFYRKRMTPHTDHDERVITYAPFVLNQESNRSPRLNRKLDTWSISVNGDEIQEPRTSDLVSGDSLDWKIAMWGSYRDRRLLERLRSEFPRLAAVFSEKDGFERTHGLMMQGREYKSPKEFRGELVGRNRLYAKEFVGKTPTLAVPVGAVAEIKRSEAYIRKGRTKPLDVCKPPHVIVGDSRNYAVFSNEYMVIPHPQIGISGKRESKELLILLTLYLNSRIARYFEFFEAPRWGVWVSDSSLKTLERLPVPIGDLPTKQRRELLDLHKRMVAASKTKLTAKRQKKRKGDPRQMDLFETESSNLDALFDELNQRIDDLVMLSDSERMIVDDFFECRYFANHGKVVRQTVDEPGFDESTQYCSVLTSELDAFFEDAPNRRHSCTAFVDRQSEMGMVEVHAKRKSREPIVPTVLDADSEMSKELARARDLVRCQKSQWVYFDRNLRMYDGSRTYIVKPLQRIHWLRSQALLDADSIIREILSQET